MIWFDIKQLEKELIAGNLSEKEGLNYLIANMILFSAIPYLASNRYQNPWLTFIQFAVDLLITVALVRATFRINTNGDNNHYFKRFLGLSFVTTVRLVVYLLIALIPVEIIIRFVEKTNSIDKNVNDIFMLLLEIGTGITYYFMLTKSFRRINEKGQ